MLVRTNESGFLKDTESGAIINTNMGDYHKMKAARETSKNLNDLNGKLKSLEGEMTEIKHLLSNLLSTINGSK